MKPSGFLGQILCDNKRKSISQTVTQRLKLKKQRKKFFKCSYTLIEIAIVLLILGILISIFSSTWTAFIAYYHQLKYEERIKKIKSELLSNSLDLDDFNLFLSSSLLKKYYPQSYMIYSQAFLKTYPMPCNYQIDSPKNFDASFLKLKYLNQDINNILYIVVLDGKGKVNKDFKFLDENYLEVKDPKLKFFYVTLDDLKYKYCPSKKISNYYIDCVKPKEIINFYKEASLKIIYPAKYTYLKYSTFNTVYSLSKSKKNINIALSSPINSFTFFLYDSSMNLIDKRKEYLAYLDENLIPEDYNLTLKVSSLGKNLYKISWKIGNLNMKTYKCLIDFGDGENMYIPNCEKYSYLLHRYKYEGNFELKFFISNGDKILYNQTLLSIENYNLKPYIDFFQNKELLEFFISDNAEDKDICYVYLNSKLFLKSNNCKHISLKLTKYDFPCSLKLVILDKNKQKTSLCDILNLK